MRSYLFSSVLLAGLFVGADHSFQKELACFNAIKGFTKSGSLSFTNDDIMIPGIHIDQKDGFFLYTEKKAYFCEFPGGPIDRTKPGTFIDYLQLEPTNSKPIYATYSENLVPDPLTPSSAAKTTSLISGPNPAPSLVNLYKKVHCKESLTMEAKTKLIELLKDQVSNTKNHHDFVVRRLKDKKIPIPTERKNQTVEALSACGSVHGLSDTVSTEILKFAPAEKPARLTPPGQN